MGLDPRRITVCIPHWQVRRYITLCLRSIRKHSADYDLEVIVVDNGSHDDSLDYLRSLSWIRLIERPEESPANWPENVFTAWDRGREEASGRYYVTMHSDVFVRRDGWLDPLIRTIERAPDIAASGAWKLEIEPAWYRFQKRLFGYLNAKAKAFVRARAPAPRWKQPQYPRDYCAMYRTEVLRDHGLTFRPNGAGGGGAAIASRVWDAGWRTALVPVGEMARHVCHIAHGTAAVTPGKALRHRAAQRKAQRRVARLLREPWIRALEAEESLDLARGARVPASALHV